MPLAASISSAVSGSSGCRIVTLACSAVFIARPPPALHSYGHPADGNQRRAAGRQRDPAGAAGGPRARETCPCLGVFRLARTVRGDELVRQEDEFIFRG